MTDNPFERGYVAPDPAPVDEPVSEPDQSEPAAKSRDDRPMITEPGAYPDIDEADYHRNPNLLPGPSLSSSGAKKILSQSPYHYWFDSPLNPDRPPEEAKSHFSFGKAAHDLILLTDRWPEHYHTLPEGFAWNKTKMMPDAIAEAEAAREMGKVILKHDEAETVKLVAAEIRKNRLAMATLTGGVSEETLAWKDPQTGVWLRARPDFRPDSIKMKRAVMAVSDLKFMAPTFCSPAGFSRAIDNFGYHQSAAFYADGIRAIYGHYPTHWVFVVVEKDPPHTVSLYELPAEDIERGRLLNRRAINVYAQCLERGEWPAYADKNPREVGLPPWARNRIDDATPEEYAFAAASEPQTGENA